MPAFVYIVESPSAKDLADGRTEGASLRETLRLSSTPFEYRLTVNVEEFLRAFDLSDANNPLLRQLQAGNVPLVHLSMHGSDQGIGLTDNTAIDWASLRSILTPLNNVLELGVFVAFSTCGGANSIRMSMVTDDADKAFYGTVGSFDNVRYDDALIAFSVFYHHWFRHQPVDQCVERMCVASGHSGFRIYSGTEQKESYRQYVRRQNLAEALLRPATATPSNPLLEALAARQGSSR